MTIYIYINNKLNKCYKCWVIENDITDHYSQVIKINLENKQKIDYSNRKYIRIYNKKNLNKLRENIYIRLLKKDREKDINVLAKDLETIIEEEYNNCMPLKRISRKNGKVVPKIERK